MIDDNLVNRIISSWLYEIFNWVFEIIQFIDFIVLNYLFVLFMNMCRY